MNLTKSLTRRAFSMGGLTGLAALLLPDQSFGQGTAVVGKFASTDEEKANVKVVEDFCGAWAKKDFDTMASSLADNCSHRINQASPPIVGKETLMTRFKDELGKIDFDLKILKAVVLGPVVLTQREDKIGSVNGNPPRTLRIAAGMFFVDNGKIADWTDFELK
jgi:limonene-1,2-epoxide hydrolase